MAEARVLIFVASLIFVIGAARRSLGRLTWRVLGGSFWFLLTRPAVAATWSLGSAACGVLLFPPMMSTGGITVASVTIAAGVSILCGGGVAALVVGIGWMILRARAASPVFEPVDGERELDRMPASHVLRGESRSGTLVRTTRRLVFVPRRFNVQLDLWSLDLQAIERVEVEGARGLVVSSRGSESWLLVNDAAAVLQRLRGLTPDIMACSRP